MYKVHIEKREYISSIDCEWAYSYVSVDANKPADLSGEEWNYISKIVEVLAKGNEKEVTNVEGPGCKFDLHSMIVEKDWRILAESEHYFIMAEDEDATLFSKANSSRITSVGDFYGDPAAAYIDPYEQFCITVGCGLIKYNLEEPFEGYMYDRNTPQWIEVGREGDIEWCDCIEGVTDSHIVVSCEGTDRRRFNLETLEKENL